MQQLVVVRGMLEQPLMIVLGILTAAGAAKSGYGAWALGGIVSFASIYMAVIVAFAVTRGLRSWLASVRHREALAPLEQQSGR